MRYLTQVMDERGATAIEYAMLASAIAAIIIVVAYAIGAHTFQFFFRFDELFGSF